MYFLILTSTVASRWSNLAFQIYLILDMLAQGFPRDEMRNDYRITEEHIRVALRFAAEYG